jgi:F0F1-type ATP synthase assembly protein I
MSGITARPQSMSTGAAFFRVIVTLLMFIVVFITFLIAPLVALGIGFLVYLVWRSRGARPARSSDAGAAGTQSAGGFGAGAS